MPNPVQILLVEDHPADITLVRNAFDRITTAVDLHVVFDGHEALQYLRNEGRHENVPRPSLILLDLTLPRRTGFEVLREILLDPELRCIPIIMLTSSGDPEDVRNAYLQGANSYLVKPTSAEGFFRLVQALETYWLRMALLPVPPVTLATKCAR